MKDSLVLKIFLAAAFLSSLLSLALHSDALLVAAAVLGSVCLVLTFVKKRR